MNAEPAPPAPVDDTLVARLRTAGCVFAEEEAALLAAQATDAADLERLTAARVGGLPLEHVLGWAAFAGLRVVVEPGVFVPRRRTELMVTEAVAHALSRPAAGASGAGPVQVVDLCCGSGAVAAAVLARLDAAGRPSAILAADLDPAAVRCAARNLPTTSVLVSDLFTGLPPALRGRVDVLTANVPYVPTASLVLMPREAREHEAPMALDGGADGLSVLRRLVAEAPGWLAPGGAVLVETSVRQQPAAVAAMVRAGLATRVAHDDDLEATVLVGTRR